jgi:hypothetical protein
MMECEICNKWGDAKSIDIERCDKCHYATDRCPSHRLRSRLRDPLCEACHEHIRYQFD